MFSVIINHHKPDEIAHNDLTKAEAKELIARYPKVNVFHGLSGEELDPVTFEIID